MKTPITPKMVGPFYFAGSTRARRAWCVLATLPIVTAAVPRDRVYAICGARIRSPLGAVSWANAPALLPVSAPICRFCEERMDNDAIREVWALVRLLKIQHPKYGLLLADPGCRATAEYVRQCHARPLPPGTWRIEDRNVWGHLPKRERSPFQLVAAP